MRRYSDEEIDAAVLESQDRRQDERIADPSWVVVADEWTATFGGGTWMQTAQEN